MDNDPTITSERGKHETTEQVPAHQAADGRRAAETRGREEYSENVRARGSPIGHRETAEPHWEDTWRLPDGRKVHVRLDGERDWMHSGERDPTRELPTGEQLLAMENEDAPRAEKLRSKFFEKENIDGFLDAEKEGAKVVQEVLSPPQHGSARTLTPTVEIAPVQPSHADAGDALTGITVFAVLTAEAVRSGVKHFHHLERK
jgi:hypothetical protein